MVYATEADLLNVALFGKTGGEWRREFPDLHGNMRDHATIVQLVVLANIESLNAVLIHQGLAQSERLLQLNQVAIQQIPTLLKNQSMKKLREPSTSKR